MATLDLSAQLTLVELAKRSNNMKLLEIAETLNKVNKIIDDAIFLESNQPTSHVCTMRVALPTGTWRKLNAGVPTEASQTKQVVEGIGMLESYSKVDKALVDIAPDPKQFRFNEDKAFLEGLSQTLANTLMYGNASVYPEQFNGLATRYNGLSSGSVESAGGSGADLTSVWVVQWGDNKVHMVYPKGSPTLGVKMNDLGESTVQDSNGNEYQAYRTHFLVNAGLVVRDERCVKRIANIETTGASNIFDEDLLIGLLNELPHEGEGAVIYANKTVKTQMDIIAKDKTNVYYTAADAFGKPTLYFRGFPVKQVDAILDTESAVS